LRTPRGTSDGAAPGGPPGPGLLVLVVGPSGVGKDTLIMGARARLAGQGVVFARREITRPPDPDGEDHAPASEAEFAERRERGLYLLSWRAHGLGYGLPIALMDRLAAGETVVANVSRAVLDEARARFARVRVVSVRAEAAVIRARLQARNRETAEDIEQRVVRAGAFQVAGPDVVEVRNDAAPEAAVEAFVALIRA